MLMPPRAAKFWLAIALTSCVSVMAPAQVQQGTIEGTVLNPDGTPATDTTVTLLDNLGTAVAVTIARAGVFRLTNVAPGLYALRAEAPPLRATATAIAVRAGLPMQVDLRLAASAAEQMTVRSDERETHSVATSVTLAGDALRRAAVRLRSRGLQSALASLPGWSTEDNGLLHVRGVDDGFLYVIDGIPVYERLDGLFGVAPDPSMIDSINVRTGYIPPEFGFKSGGVIEVRTAGRAAANWQGAVDVGGGTERSRDFSAVSGGPLGATTALTLGAAGESSSRFLDPVHPDNLHNDGGTASGGGQFGWNISPSSVLTAVAGLGRSDFDVPHGGEQEEAGQDQRQRIRNYWHTVSWQHAPSTATVGQVAGYYRYGSAALAGSEQDVPLFTNANRSLRRFGALASFTRHAGRHLVKLGGEASQLHLRERFSFAVTDRSEAEEAGLSDAALAFTSARPFDFRDTAGGTLLSLYVQDSIRATSRLTVDVGLRGDWVRQLTAASQWSPRLGAAYHFPSTQTTLRASFARFFQPPQPENLLLASSAQARALSPFADETHEGGSELQPERQSAVDAGLSQMLTRHVRLDLSYWRRTVRNAADPNVFFGTTIVFPNSVARGRASGIDLRVELPRLNGWSSYASYANARVTQFGPINGGVFLEDDVIDIGEGTPFTPDHDQRHVAAAGVSYEHARSGLTWSLAGRYESGTPLEVDVDELDELERRPGAELADFERGRVKPRQVYDLAVSQRVLERRRVVLDLRLSLMNIFGERWAYNFGNPFSGTHFGAGRTMKIGIRAGFR